MKLKIFLLILLILIIGCSIQETAQDTVKQAIKKVEPAITREQTCEDKAKDIIPTKVQIVKNTASQNQIKTLIWLDGTVDKYASHSIFEKDGDVYVQKPSWSSKRDYFLWEKEGNFFKVRFKLKLIDDRWWKVVGHEFIDCKIN